MTTFLRVISCAVLCGWALVPARAAAPASTATPENELNGYPQAGPGITDGKVDLVRPDEGWIDQAAAAGAFMQVSDLRAAWTQRNIGAEVLTMELPNPSASIFFSTTPQALWQQLDRLKGAAPRQLAVTLKDEPVPGGYGLDPLAARSVYGAALLFGIGGVDTGIGTFQHEKLAGVLESSGVFDPGTKFIPFWSQAAFYDTRAHGGADGVDYNTLYAGKADAPLFGHTAPGVLVSGYQTKGKLLLVVVNYTNQALGKLGDVWVNLPEIFPKKAVQFTNPENGLVLRAHCYDRKAHTMSNNTVFNIAVAPGDFGLILIETNS